MVTGEVCEVCHGQGTVAEEHRIDVHIPAGVPNRWKSMYTLDDGTQIRLCVAQKKHPRFERVGDDLIQHVHLSLKEVGERGVWHVGAPRKRYSGDRSVQQDACHSSGHRRHPTVWRDSE